MPTRTEVNTSINAKIQALVTAAKHRATNQEILDYVDQQTATKSFAALSGTSWDITANPLYEKALTGNIAITTTGKIAGKSRGAILFTGNTGATVTIDGVSVNVNATGDTLVEVYVKANGSLFILSHATVASGGGGVVVPTLSDVTFSPVTNIQETGNIWAAITNNNTFGNTGLATVSLAAGADGYIQALYSSGSYDALFGFRETAANNGYANIKAGFYIADDTLKLKVINNGTIIDTGVTPVVGNVHRVVRSGSQFKLQKSADGSSWTDVYTYAYSSSVQMYVSVDIYGNNAIGKLDSPKQYNLS